MNKAFFLEKNHLFGFYDEIKQTLFVTYSGSLTTDIIRQVYQWMTDLIEADPDSIARINGAVFDFQKVTRIEESNFLTVQQESTTLNQKFDLSAIPVALIAPNLDLRERIKQIVAQSPQPERKYLVGSIEEALQLFSQLKGTSPSPSITVLDMPHVTCHFDEKQGFGHITYYGVLTPDSTTEVYGWMFKIFDHYGANAVRAGFFDFRHVSRFHPGNTRKTSQGSSQLNVKYDMSRIPIALLVRDAAQEQFVRVMMHLTPQEERKRIFTSTEEGLEFIENFNLTRSEK